MAEMTFEEAIHIAEHHLHMAARAEEAGAPEFVQENFQASCRRVCFIASLWSAGAAGVKERNANN